MAEEKHIRRHQRRPLNCMLSVSWQDKLGNARLLQARGLDTSEAGVRIEASEPIDVRSNVYIRAEQHGLMGSACVRHCTRRGLKYIIGLEFTGTDREKSEKTEPETPAETVDYYELLQISPNAQAETIHRVFRMLAARYHPDNPETGNNEMFLALTQAYETLSNPARRATYDAHYHARSTKAMPIFEMKDFLEGIEGESNRRMGILCLLYNRRRRDADDPGLSLLEFEDLMAFPREHLLFTLWFLKEKQYIRSEHNADYVITAEGVEFVETRLPTNRVLSDLLQLPHAESRKPEMSEPSRDLSAET